MKRINHIKQDDIATVLSVNQSTVSKYINDKAKLSVKSAIRLEDELGIPVRAWLDIKSYLDNTTSKQATNSNTKPKEKI